MLGNFRQACLQERVRHFEILLRRRGRVIPYSRVGTMHCSRLGLGHMRALRTSYRKIVKHLSPISTFNACQRKTVQNFGAPALTGLDQTIFHFRAMCITSQFVEDASTDEVQNFTAMASGEDDGFVVRLRGLPWTATPDEVLRFFAGEEDAMVKVDPSECGISDIHFTYSREGRPSGEAFVEFTSEEDVEKALEKDNLHIGQRYIEVFKSKKSEMDWVIKRAGPNQQPAAEAVLRLRGLPFGCSKEEIAQFFTGLEIVPNGIMLPEDRQGRSTGEAYVQFSSQEIADKALSKHKERIGHRYIEIFKSCLSDANMAMGQGRMRSMNFGMGRPGPYDRNERFSGMGVGMGGGPVMSMGGYGRGRGGRNVKGFYEDGFEDFGSGYGNLNFGGGGRRGGGVGMRGNQRGRMNMDGGRGGQPGSHYMSGTGHSVHMRGLPFQAIEQDVFDFFNPVRPVKVEFEYSGHGRPTGEANVDFATHQEAVEAMKKHKSNMQHRYIELFLNSTSSERGGGSGSGGGFGSSQMGGSFGGNGNMGSGFNNGGGYGGGGNYGNSGGNFGGGYQGNYMGNGGGSGSGGYSNNMGGGMNNNVMGGNPNYTAF